MHNPSSTLTRPLLRLARSARLLALLAVAVAALAGTVTACSSSSSPSAAPSQTARRAHSASGPLAFSACMRSHGVPSFPDPTANGGVSIHVQPGNGIDPNSPASNRRSVPANHCCRPARRPAALSALRCGRGFCATPPASARTACRITRTRPSTATPSISEICRASTRTPRPISRRCAPAHR